MSDRDLDVVVLGASGVTGRRVAAYMAERAASTDLRWAAAGRDAAKVERVLADAGVRAPETLLADVGQPQTLRALAARARVVLDLVGPYTLYGRAVIEACVAGGAHYADLTGEIPFVRSIIDDFDAPARAAGVKVVQVCGFEALPPDLAVRLAAETARERWDEPLSSVAVEVSFTPPPGLPRPSDGISGGTLQSMLAIAATDDARSILDPGALLLDADQAAAVRRRSPIGIAPRRGSDGGVLAPMAPAPFINPAVIHRSAALADADAGRAPHPFAYSEGLLMSGTPLTLPLRWGAASAMSVTTAGLRGFTRATPQMRRRVVEGLGRFVPGSGYGPAPDRLEGWRWQLAVHARSEGANELGVVVAAEGHPGYLATARMFGELGILLAQDGATPERSGCLTPSIALGTACLERFDLARVRFSLDP